MNKLKLYIYPNACPHSHDLDPEYYNTTPLGEQGIKDHCITTSPDDCDYFYMGQVSCGTVKDVHKDQFDYIDKFPEKHIVTIEGDWANKPLPKWMEKCIFVGNAAKIEHKNFPFCVRPCMSKLLIRLGTKELDYKVKYPETKSFGFAGQYDPHGTRQKMQQCFSTNNLPNEIIINPGWLGSVDPRSPFVQHFARILENNMFSLCPRGAGEDTIRFYEGAYFGRIPIIIGKCQVMGEDYYDTSFFYRIDPEASIEELNDFFTKIYNEDFDVLIEKCKLARTYFDDVVKKYFKDPTKFFIEFLQRHKL